MHGDENNASFAIPGQAVSWLIAVLGTFVAKWEWPAPTNDHSFSSGAVSLREGFFENDLFTSALVTGYINKNICLLLCRHRIKTRTIRRKVAWGFKRRAVHQTVGKLRVHTSPLNKRKPDPLQRYLSASTMIMIETYILLQEESKSHSHTSFFLTVIMMATVWYVTQNHRSYVIIKLRSAIRALLNARTNVKDHMEDGIDGVQDSSSAAVTVSFPLQEYRKS